MKGVRSLLSRLASRPVGTSRKPSVGFVGVCLTYALATAFFAWGLSTPDLDRVWTLHHELETGRKLELDSDERDLLQATMVRHEALARELLHDEEIGIISDNEEGWISTPTVTILRTSKAKSRAIVLDVQTPKDLLPVRLRAHAKGWEQEREVGAQGEVELALPPPPKVAEVVEVELEAHGLKADPSVLGIRVSFRGDGP